MDTPADGQLIVSHVAPIDDGDTVWRPGYPRWVDGRLTEAREARPDDIGNHIDGVALPGLVNTHHHLTSTILTGLQPDDSIRLDGQQADRHRALAGAFDSELAHAACLLAYRDLAAGGVTTTVDSHAAWRTDDRIDGSLEAAVASGLRVLTTVAFFDRTELIPRSARFDTEQAVTELERLRDRYAGSRHEVEGEPLALPRCSDQMILALHQARRRLAAMHLTYARAYDEWARTTLGHPAVVYLDRLGVLDEGWLFAHPIHLDATEQAQLAASGAAVSYCASSNMAMGLETADILALRRRGIPVGLGLDHPNGHQELFAEAKTAVLAQRAFAQDGSEPSARLALRLATREGARALGLGSRIGRLAPGFDADVAIFTGLPIATGSLAEIADLLVHSGRFRRARHVLAGGRWLIENGRSRLPVPPMDAGTLRRTLLHRAMAAP